MDYENKDQIAGLLRYRTSLEEGDDAFVSLQTYVDRMGSEQDKIYYLTGENYQSIAQSPLLEAFRKKGLEVLYLDEPVDEWVVNSLQSFSDKELQAVDAADIDLSDEEVQLEGVGDEDKADRIELIDFLKKQLEERVSDVVESKRLSDSPCVLVTAQGGMSNNMERLMKMADRQFEGAKRVLEINPNHAIVKNMAALSKEGSRS